MLSTHTESALYVTLSLTDFYTLLKNTSIEHSKRFLTLVIRMMRRYDLSNKKTKTKTITKRKTVSRQEPTDRS